MFKMINQSKTQDLRSWAKWEASGAVENADNAYLRFVLSQPSKRFIHIINNSRGFYEFQCREYGFGGIACCYCFHHPVFTMSALIQMPESVCQKT